MTISGGVVIAAMIGLSVGEQIGSKDPVRLGTVARRLALRDLDQINDLVAREGTRPWLLDGDTSQVLPETWKIDAYLVPDSDSDSLRRGRVVRLESNVTRGRPVSWRIRDSVAGYAQVSHSNGSFRLARGDKDRARPFIVDGDFTDEELVSLVHFLRSSPKPPDRMVREADGRSHGTLTFPVESSWPVTAIERQPDGTIWAILQDSKRSGQTVTVRRTDRTWTVVDVVGWVA